MINLIFTPETNKQIENMKNIIIITIVSILLTSCSAERIANYKGFPWVGNGSSTIDIQRISVGGHYYIIETNTSTGSTNVTTVR